MEASFINAAGREILESDSSTATGRTFDLPPFSAVNASCRKYLNDFFEMELTGHSSTEFIASLKL